MRIRLFCSFYILLIRKHPKMEGYLKFKKKKNEIKLKKIRLG